MAKVEQRTKRPKYVQRLLDAIVAELSHAGVEAEADAEKVRGTRLHRVMVVSPQFEHLWHGERQELVWRIADRVLTDEERMKISIFITLTPDELEGEV